MKLDLALIIPDCHRPYHNQRAYNLMLKVAKALKPKELVILGDYADFYAVSSYPKNPKLPQLLIKEIEDVNQGLRELEALFPKAKKVFLTANHCQRLMSYLTEKAPALFGITDIEKLFNLNKWQVIPFGPQQLYKILGSKLYARHIPLANNPKANSAKAQASMVYGHIHRIEESHQVSVLGDNYISFSVGWLGDQSHEVYDYVKNHHQWQLGFGLVYVDRKTKEFYHQSIHIKKNYTCVINGELFSS